ncbi:MAG: ABC transporter ATP-binding protein [Archangiaceae bacterium]|nr:ABC transporter ATP-binding protein [Archangiaceae bacterium]
MIALEGLTKSFGALTAVDGVSLTVAPGEVVGLLGPNGAGKTTTLRMLAGLITPTAGRASIDGFDVQVSPLEARARLGFMTASTGLWERLTGREVMETFGQLYGLTGAGLKARVAALTAELDLGAFVDRRCGAMSSGQKQRVSIARALIADPKAYVLDEPTAALDPLAANDILKLVTQARERGKAVLFSTHRMEEAEFLCTRICFMRAGKIVAEGSPQALRAQSGQPSLTGAFLHFAGAGA